MRSYVFIFIYLLLIFLSGCKAKSNNTDETTTTAQQNQEEIIFTECYIDKINDQIAHSERLVFDSNTLQYITIKGWAVDKPAGDVASEVYVDIDREYFKAEYGGDRMDVANHFENPNYRYSGFTTTLHWLDIGSGQHEIRLAVLSNDRQTYYNCADYIEFIIE